MTGASSSSEGSRREKELPKGKGALDSHPCRKERGCEVLLTFHPLREFLPPDPDSEPQQQLFLQGSSADPHWLKSTEVGEGGAQKRVSFLPNNKLQPKCRRGKVMFLESGHVRTNLSALVPTPYALSQPQSSHHPSKGLLP